jgi:hypothetical protein
VRPTFARVLYHLDIVAMWNKCVLINVCQSYEKATDFGKGSSYRVLSNAIQIVLSEHTIPIEIFCLVLDVNYLMSLVVTTTPKMAQG